MRARCEKLRARALVSAAVVRKLPVMFARGRSLLVRAQCYYGSSTVLLMGPLGSWELGGRRWRRRQSIVSYVQYHQTELNDDLGQL